MFALLLLLLLHHHTSVASIARVQDSCVATDYPHEYVAILQARIQELESELAISKRALIPTLSTTDFEALGTLFCASSMAARKFEDTTPATAVSMVWMDGRHPQHFTPWSTAAASLMPTNILQQKQIIQMVERWGVAVVKKTLTNLQAEKLSQEVLYEVLVKPTSQFMPIHTSSNRFDYPLSLEPGTYGAEAVVAMVSALRMPLEALLGGGGARLVEASTLTILPGAKEQPIHMDNNVWCAISTDINQCRVVTVFVALVDIAENMGCLDVWLGTHTHFATGALYKKQYLKESPSVRMSVPAGTAVLMDSRLQHRGSANTSDKKRVIVYTTWASATGPLPQGSTYSLREEYKGKFTLQDVLATM